MANGALARMAYDPSAGMATPLWAEAPSRYKRNFDPQFDPTGMRAAGNQFSEALSPLLLGSQPDQRDGSDGSLNIAQGPMLSFDPYGGQVITNQKSKAFKEFNKDPAAWLKAKRAEVEAMPETTQGFDLDSGYTSTPTGRAQQLAQLEAAEKAYGDYQTKYGDWKSKYTSAGLDDDIKQFAKYSGYPNLESETSAVNRINSNLARYGITDMDQIGVAQGPDGKPIYYNTQNGQRLPDQIAHFKSNDHGTLRVGFAPGRDGSVGLTNRFEAPKAQFDDYMGKAVLASILGVGGAAAGGALASAFGGTAGGTTGAAAAGTGAGSGAGSTWGTIAGKAVGQGISGAAGSAMQGGDVGQGFLGGLISGGVGAGMGAANPGQFMFDNPMYQNLANRALGGGLASAGNAAVRGGDPLRALGQGVFSGGATGALSQAGTELGMNDSIANQFGRYGGQYLTGQVFQPQPRRRG